jgi:two-component system alkaline phosphatase synthesis response regulator PhoP
MLKMKSISDRYKKTILVVDDEQPARHLMRAILEKRGYKVDEAPGGLECLEKLNLISPDLILLDIYMPDMSGIEVVNELKQNDKMKDIPVIYVTANVNDDVLVTAFRSGCSDYVTKPISEVELLARIECALKEKQYERDRIQKERVEAIAFLFTPTHPAIQ